MGTTLGEDQSVQGEDVAQGKTPFAFVTKDGQVVRHTVLDEFALKADSKQLEDQWQSAYGEHGLRSPMYNPETLARLTEINVYHYRCCRTKARDTAGLGWVLRPVGDDVPNNDAHERLMAWLEGLTESLTTVLEKAQYDFETTGYAALEVVRENDDPEGEVVDLIHVPSYTLRAHFSRNKFAQRRGNKQVWFKRFGYEFDVNRLTGNETALRSTRPEERANELLWWVNYTTRSDYYGLPDVLPALGALQGDVARRDYNIAFFANYGVPAYAVWITGEYDPGEVGTDGKTDLERSITDVFANMVNKPHSTLVMAVPGTDVKIEIEPLGSDVKEAAFQQYRKDNRDEVLAAHGVPPYRLGIAETGSLGGSTARESTNIYKRSIIEPRQTQLEQMLNGLIRDSFGIDDWRLKFEEIDTADLEADLNMLGKLFEMGAVSPRAVAKYFADQFGLDPHDNDDPALDAHYVNGRMITEDPNKEPVPEQLQPFAGRPPQPQELEEEQDPGGL